MKKGDRKTHELHCFMSATYYGCLKRHYMSQRDDVASFLPFLIKGATVPFHDGESAYQALAAIYNISRFDPNSVGTLLKPILLSSTTPERKVNVETSFATVYYYKICLNICFSNYAPLQKKYYPELIRGLTSDSKRARLEVANVYLYLYNNSLY